VAEQQALEPSLSFAQLAEQVQRNFHVKVHPRSIERQLQREKKLRQVCCPLTLPHCWKKMDGLPRTKSCGVRS